MQLHSCYVVVLVTAIFGHLAIAVPGPDHHLHDNKQEDQDHGSPATLSVEDEEKQARDFLDAIQDERILHCNRQVVGEWTYASDINEANRQEMLKATLEHATFEKEFWKNLTRYNWRRFSDKTLKREFQFLSVLGAPALSDDKFKELQNTVASMEEIYSTAKVTPYGSKANATLSLEPELTQILKTSRNESELQHVWNSWRDQSGKKMRKLFNRYVDLTNEVARLNNFTDAADYWLHSYESETFVEDLEIIWQQLKPLYQQLHAYVRRRLREVYGDSIVSRDGPIPGHLLGNMWSQSWSNVLSVSEPYPGLPSVDVTEQMKEQGYDAMKIFRVAEEFFTSLNLSAMPDEFWEHSILEKPSGREIVCHASAWDFCNGKDFRIKQCTVVTMDDLITAHHEMGHIQYDLQYKDQRFSFRNGANPGFHEALGDVLALSASTPKHLRKVGLLKDHQHDPRIDLNFLYLTALDKIAFLPFGFLMDRWRWDVFSGKVEPQNYNCHWWKYRLELQGIKPPSKRTEDDFDAGAKYHIPASVPYIRYFVSFIIQFQFHKSLCILANEYDPNDPNKPLHMCDIYKSTAAGNKLGDMMQLGMSKPWPEALEVMTGQQKMDASPLLEYFSPLIKWLEEENKRTGEYIGWVSEDSYCLPEAHNYAAPWTSTWPFTFPLSVLLGSMVSLITV